MWNKQSVYHCCSLVGEKNHIALFLEVGSEVRKSHIQFQCFNVQHWQLPTSQLWFCLTYAKSNLPYIHILQYSLRKSSIHFHLSRYIWLLRDTLGSVWELLSIFMVLLGTYGYFHVFPSEITKKLQYPNPPLPLPWQCIEIEWYKFCLLYTWTFSSTLCILFWSREKWGIKNFSYCDEDFVL